MSGAVFGRWPSSTSTSSVSGALSGTGARAAIDRFSALGPETDHPAEAFAAPDATGPSKVTRMRSRNSASADSAAGGAVSIMTSLDSPSVLPLPQEGRAV